MQLKCVNNKINKEPTGGQTSQHLRGVARHRERVRQRYREREKKRLGVGLGGLQFTGGKRKDCLTHPALAWGSVWPSVMNSSQVTKLAFNGNANATSKHLTDPTQSSYVHNFHIYICIHISGTHTPAAHTRSENFLKNSKFVFFFVFCLSVVCACSPTSFPSSSAPSL